MHRKYTRWTTESFIEEARKIHGNKIDYSKVKFVNSFTKINLSCNSCEHSWGVLPNNHLRGSGCKNCQYFKLPQNQSWANAKFVSEARKRHPGKFEYLSEYKNNKIKIQIKCLICNDIFWQRPGSHLEGCGCKKCQYSLLPQNQPMSTKEYEERCKKIHDNRYSYCNDYKGNHCKIKIYCKKHKENFLQEAGAHLYKKQGCPKCNLSKGEVRVEKWLKEKSFNYVSQKTFDDCRKKSPLRFDFYLPDVNICIEYDGEQHFEAFPRFGGKIRLEETKKNDRMKEDYCESKGIGLVRIPYFRFKEVEKILEEELLC